MTLALGAGLLLLVLVGLLAAWQRRQVRDMTRPAVPGHTRPAGSAAGLPISAASSEGVRSDPLNGGWSFDGDRTWSSDEPLSLGSGLVDVEFIAGPDGPGPEHTQWLQQAVSRWDTLEEEIIALLVDVLAPLGVSRDDLEPLTMTIGPVAGPFEGRISYETMHDSIASLYVRSTEQWDHLEPHLEIVDPDEGSPRRYHIDPLAGRVEYDGDDVWSPPERMRIAGRQMAVLMVAGEDGPGEEHTAWLQALIDAGPPLLERADVMAVDQATPGTSLAQLDHVIVVVGPDENGRFIGGLAYQWTSDRSRKASHVWTRDRWQHLSTERG